MNAVNRASVMTDPDNVGTIAAIVGGLAATGYSVMKMWKQFFADRADLANSQAEIQMLREYQNENKELRARIDAKDVQIASLMQEKFTYQADLKSALDKIQYMSEQIEDLKGQLTAIKDAVKATKPGTTT